MEGGRQMCQTEQKWQLEKKSIRFRWGPHSDFFSYAEYLFSTKFKFYSSVAANIVLSLRERASCQLWHGLFNIVSLMQFWHINSKGAINGINFDFVIKSLKTVFHFTGPNTYSKQIGSTLKFNICYIFWLASRRHGCNQYLDSLSKIYLFPLWKLSWSLSFSLLPPISPDVLTLLSPKSNSLSTLSWTISIFLSCLPIPRPTRSPFSTQQWSFKTVYSIRPPSLLKTSTGFL